MSTDRETSLSDLIRATELVKFLENCTNNSKSEKTSRYINKTYYSDNKFKKQTPTHSESASYLNREGFLRNIEEEAVFNKDTGSNKSPNSSLHSLDNISFNEYASVDNSITKPPFSYAQLISQAILSTPDHRMTLNRIYHYISSRYKHYNMNDKGWQNSIRHNLSLNKCFQKLPKNNEDMGKGSYWQITPEKKTELQKMAFVPKKKKLTIGNIYQDTLHNPSSFNISENDLSRSCLSMKGIQIPFEDQEVNAGVEYSKLNQFKTNYSLQHNNKSNMIVKQYYPLIIVEEDEEEEITPNADFDKFDSTLRHRRLSQSKSTGNLPAMCQSNPYDTFYRSPVKQNNSSAFLDDNWKNKL